MSKTPVLPPANAQNLLKMRAKPESGFSVSWGVRRVGIIFLAVSALALVGCNAVEGVKEQVGRDTFKPTEPTTTGVVAHVYLDRSGSAKHLRGDIGQQLVNLLDFYPEAITTTAHWYAQDVSKMKTTIASRAIMQEIVDQYENDPHGDNKKSKGTNLALAFRDLQAQCAREPEKQVIGIFVTDGGFEDDPSTLSKEAEVLRDLPNAPMLIFLGLNADGTKKITNLDSIVRDRFIMGASGELQKQYFDITLTGGEAMMAQSRKAIESLITQSKNESSSDSSATSETSE